MEAKIKYEFSGKMWKHDSEGGWYFVSVPKVISEEIREHLQWQEEGWGRMKCKATVKNIEWDTAIWFDTKLGVYILPVKASVRSQAQLTTQDSLNLTLWV